MVAPSGSYRISAYVEAAKALDRPILVISNSEHSLVPEIANGITVDFSDPAKALAESLVVLDAIDIACVIATDDRCVELCSRIADHFGLPQNNIAAAQITQRKDLGRAVLRNAGCKVPEFEVIELNATAPVETSLDYPVVIKPLGLAASRGVIRADNREEFLSACARIDMILEQADQRGYARDHLLVESYLDGDEYAIEGFMLDGEFHRLAIFDKPEPLTGPFFEETYYLTPTRLSASSQNELLAEVAACCAAYGLEQGPVHAEARFTADGPVLLELAARTIGGQCGQLIEFSLQQKLEELVIRGMCGLLPEAPEAGEAAGVLMIPITERGILKRIEGLTAAMQTPFVKDVEIHINPGYELVPLPEGASYLGFIFAQAPDFEQTYAALKTAHAKLRFVTQPNWQLELRSG